MKYNHLKLFLITTGLAVGGLAVSALPVAAQFEDGRTPDRKESSSVKEQKKVQEQSPDAHPARYELDEAVRFLNKTGDDLSLLTVYKLAGTDKFVVAPQLADAIVTSGDDAARLAKIAERVLLYHKLQDICSIILFTDESPRIFTYKLRSISLSTNLFNILSDDEATALIAHEVGHLYLGKDLGTARLADNAQLARIVELKCDVIVLITLKNLKIDPGVLISALKKLIAAREKLNLKTTSDHSPLLEDRINLTEIFLKQNAIKRQESGKE